MRGEKRGDAPQVPDRRLHFVHAARDLSARVHEAVVERQAVQINRPLNCR